MDDNTEGIKPLPVKQNIDNNHEHEPVHNISISTLVGYLLLILGLIAEFYAIFRLPALKEIPSDEVIWVKLAVTAMLVHQFMTVRNFHIIDHATALSTKIKCLGNWITNNIWEQLIRFLVFIMLACLTGEIAYLRLVTNESPNQDLTDISWLTPFFTTSALIITLLMLMWSSFGLAHEWKNVLKTLFESKKYFDVIVYFPIRNPYITFVVCDLMSCLFWLSINHIVKGHANAKIGLYLLWSSYVILIGVRFLAEIWFNLPRLLFKINMYVRAFRTKKETTVAIDTIPSWYNWSQYVYIGIMIIGLGFMTNAMVGLYFSTISESQAHAKELRTQKGKELAEKAALFLDASFSNGPALDSAYLYFVEAAKYDTIFRKDGFNKLYHVGLLSPIRNYSYYKRVMQYAHLLDTTNQAVIDSLKYTR